MKRLIYLALIVLISGLPLFASSGHDHKKPVHSIMHELASSMNLLKKAAKRRDYRKAGMELKKIAVAFKELDSVNPSKGSKEEWDAIHGEIIMLAGQGVEACEKRDWRRLNEIVELIEQQEIAGHFKFR